SLGERGRVEAADDHGQGGVRGAGTAGVVNTAVDDGDGDPGAVDGRVHVLDGVGGVRPAGADAHGLHAGVGGVHADMVELDQGDALVHREGLRLGDRDA